jgi:hypothetical protein
MDKKKCLKCGEVKTIDKFEDFGHRHANNCKECEKKKDKKTHANICTPFGIMHV